MRCKNFVARNNSSHRFFAEAKLSDKYVVKSKKLEKIKAGQWRVGRNEVLT